MRKYLYSASLLFLISACTTGLLLEMPPVQDSPEPWGQIKKLILQNTDCPNLAGMYSEPPNFSQSIQDSGTDPVLENGSYYGYLPFYLADRKELENGEISRNNQFLIRQPDVDNFYFMFVIPNTRVVEYHFRSNEGDFKCKDGYIEFPGTSSYGMVEGMSVNYQIRNVILREKTGELVIQKTIGPYRGNPSGSNIVFDYEYLNYPLYEKE